MRYFEYESDSIHQIPSGEAGASGKVTYILVGITVFFMLAAITWSTLVVCIVCLVPDIVCMDPCLIEWLLINECVTLQFLVVHLYCQAR